MKNFYFLGLFLIGLILVAIFNYTVDFKKAFHHEKGMILTEIMPEEELFFLIDQYKNYKNDTLLIGFSEIDLMSTDIRETAKNFYNAIYVSTYSYKTLYNCVKRYVNLHKETKKVVIVLSYTTFLSEGEYEKDSNEQVNNKNYLINVLFSKDNTFSNIDLIINCFRKLIRYTIFKKQKEFCFHPIISQPNIVDQQVLDKKNLNKIEYLTKTVDFLKENNIEYQIVIPPNNAVYLCLLKYYNFDVLIEKFKRNLVEHFDVVYDFLFVNRITSTNTFSKYNYWFCYPDHPSHNFSYKLILFLFFNNTSDDSIYMKLTKNNIDEKLKTQKKLINNFIKENKDYVNYYIENATENSVENKYCTEINNIPFEIERDKNYINKKVTDKMSEDYNNILFYKNILN